MQNLSFIGFKIRWFVVFFILMNIIGVVIGLVFPFENDTALIANVILIGSMLLYMLYQSKKHQISYSEATLKDEMTKKRWATYIGFSFIVKAVGVLMLSLIAISLYLLFSEFFDLFLGLFLQIESVDITPLYIILTFINICIFAPIWEELFFRGILLRRFAVRWKATTSIVVSSLIFGLVHFAGNSMLHAFALGCFLSYIYLRTRNIWVPIIVHSVSNFISFLAMLAPVEQGQLEIPAKEALILSFWQTGIALLVLVLIVLFIIVKNWSKLRQIKKIEEPVFMQEEGNSIEQQQL